MRRDPPATALRADESLTQGETNRLVDHLAGKAVLESQRAGILAAEHEIVFGQLFDKRMMIAKTRELFEQPRWHDVADDRSRPDQVTLLFGASAPREIRSRSRAMAGLGSHDRLRYL